MALLPRIKTAFRRPAADDTSESPVDTPGEKTEKYPATDDAAAVTDGDSPVEHPDQAMQRGVQEVEAVTLTWTRWTLVAVFFKYASSLILWSWCGG